MVTRDEIEDALRCDRCATVAEDHLRYCEPDECGVTESYRRILERIEAGDHDDWGAPGRAAMAAMMTAEPWMHEHHDHRIVHDNEAPGLEVTDQQPAPALAGVVSIAEARSARPPPPLTDERMAGLARDRLVRLKEARPATAADEPDPPLWWEIDGPAGLVELHAMLTVREVLRRGEHLVNIEPGDESPEWSVLREHGIDELQAARALLWAASEWLEADDVLDLVATAAHRMGWSHLRARDLFSEMLGDGPEGTENSR